MRNRPVNAAAADDDLAMFLFEAFACPAVEDMDLSRSGVPNLVMVGPFVTGWKSCKSTFHLWSDVIWQYRYRPLLGV